MAELRKDIPVTYEFEDYIPPEEDGVIFEEPARQWQTTAPDVASMFDDEKPGGILDKEKREAFVRAGQNSASGRAVSDEKQASSGKTFNPSDDWYTAEPEVAYTMRDEDKEKREAFLKSMPDPNLGRPKVSTGRPAGKKNLSRRTMSDEVASFIRRREETLTMPPAARRRRGAGLVEWEEAGYYCFLSGVSEGA